MIETFQACGSVEEALPRLLQTITNPTVAAENNAGTADNDRGTSNLTPDALLERLNPDILTNDDTVGGPSASEIGQRDVEMEDEIKEELATGDALSDYDIEVTNEGEAINEYLAFLDSRGSCEKASTSL